MGPAEHKLDFFFIFIIALIILAFLVGFFISKTLYSAEAEHYKEQLVVCTETPKFNFYNISLDDKEQEWKTQGKVNPKPLLL